MTSIYTVERTRTIQVVKSRGMAHSNKVREFLLSAQGVELIDVYMPDTRVMTGSERIDQRRPPALASCSERDPRTHHAGADPERGVIRRTEHGVRGPAVGIGRDAAEVAFASPFGDIEYDKPEVWIEAQGGSAPGVTTQAVRAEP